MNDQPAIAIAPTEPTPPKPKDTIREVGLKRFDNALTGVTEHINYAAQLLAHLAEHEKEFNVTIDAIRRWRANVEDKLKNIPSSMQTAMREMMQAASDELENTLHEIGEEITIADLNKEPEEEIAF